MLAPLALAGTPCRTGSRATGAASRRALLAAAPLARVRGSRACGAALSRPVAASASFSVTPPARDLHLSSLTAVTPLDGCVAASPPALRSRRGVCCQPALRLAAVAPRRSRYADKVAGLRDVFSEYALIKYRVLVEVRWLQVRSRREDGSARSAFEPHAACSPQTLSSIAAVKEVPPLSAAANQFLEAMIADFGPTQAEEVKKFEATTNHDVKAVEYAIKRCVCRAAVRCRAALTCCCAGTCPQCQSSPRWLSSCTLRARARTSTTWRTR
jgi:hypothetical protein